MPVSKELLSREVADRLGFKPSQCAEVLECLLVEIVYHLKRGERVQLKRFGSFVRVRRIGKPNARNPKTNELHPVPPFYTVTFVVGPWRFELPAPRQRK